MKSTYKYFGLFLATGSLLAACSKVPSGYLSEQIRYPDNPIQIQKGMVVETNPIDNDGSSGPVTYELLDIRDATTHQHADSVYKNQGRYVFIAQFDPTTDTTVALLNSKRKLIQAPCFDFNAHTGAFDFYGTTVNVPSGTYEYDVKASNESGSKIYKNIATFTLYDGLPYEIDAGGGAWFQDGTTANGDIGQPLVTIQRISTDGDRVILKIVDKNGTPWNPANNEFISRGDRSDFKTFARFHPLIVTDTSLACDFEVTPFPLVQGAQGYTIYYRIPSQFARLDPGLAPTSARIYSVNPRFTFRIYQDGTYLVTVQVKNATRDPI
ncbi:MAG TPA: hypothetical protein VL832_05390 [Puia sp.]|jgi:hypothetical protein|nr:hypothetical protein [Puia sp.]